MCALVSVYILRQKTLNINTMTYWRNEGIVFKIIFIVSIYTKKKNNCNNYYKCMFCFCNNIYASYFNLYYLN